MIDQINIAKRSNKLSEKNKNGDYCNTVYLEKESILIATLADGVGSNACDWKASQMSCDLFTESFQTSKEKNIRDSISFAMDFTNTQVLNESGICKGMKATFVVLLWDIVNELVYYVSVGDSRLYTYQNNQIVQLSNDDAILVVRRKQDGTPITVSGAVVSAVGINNAMGSKALTYTVETLNLGDITGFVLATDGFYDIFTDFNTEMADAFNHISLQKGVDKLAKKVNDNQKDDASVIALRYNPKREPIRNIYATMEDFDTKKTGSTLVVTTHLIGELEQAIKEKNSEKSNLFISFVEDNNLQIDFNQYDTFIKLMFENKFNDNAVYQRLVSLMKESR